MVGVDAGTAGAVTVRAGSAGAGSGSGSAGTGSVGAGTGTAGTVDVEGELGCALCFAADGSASPGISIADGTV